MSEKENSEKGALLAYKRTEKDKEFPFLSEIVYKRVTAYSLPINFTLEAYLAISCLAGNPGQAVVVLVDCLNSFEGELVTTTKLVDLYPYGFYNMDTFSNIVDNFMKTKTHKWSNIY